MEFSLETCHPLEANELSLSLIYSWCNVPYGHQDKQKKLSHTELTGRARIVQDSEK